MQLTSNASSLRWPKMLLLIFAFGLAPLWIQAQTVQGDLVGTVKDSQGAVVPGAKVTITNESTGAARSLETDVNGEFRAVGFFVGTYKVEFEKQGFKKTTVPGVKVEAVTLKRVDATLDVGEVTEVVEVLEAAPTVTTEGSTINYAMPRVAYDKPISDFTRSGWALDPAMWSPGSAGGRNGLFLWGGVPGSGVELNVEGGQQSVQVFLNPTSIQEISIVSGTAPAEYSRAVTVNSTFKSGTNDLHAEYIVSLASTVLNVVRSPFASPTQVRNPAIPQWRHNLDVGGPVYIPKVFDGRNKAFFYFNLSKPRGTRTLTVGTATIPTERMLAGDFGQIARAINDPLTGQPFSNNMIPAGRLSSVSRAVINEFRSLFRFVTPNVASNNAELQQFGVNTERRILTKFDVNVGSKDVMSFSYQTQDRESASTQSVNAGFAAQFTNEFPTATRQVLPQHRWSVGHTHTFSPRLVNQLRVAVLRDLSTSGGVTSDGSAPVFGKDLLSKWGIQGVPATNLQGFPGININNWWTMAQELGAGSWDSRYQFNENITYVVGSHTIKGGASGIKSLQDNLFNPGFGSYNFDGRFTGEPFADFMLGVPGSFTRTLARPTIARRIWEWGGYAQDDWRVNQKLTLSYGLRWDYYIAPYDKNGLYFNFDLKSGRIVVPDQKALSNVNPAWRGDLVPVVLGSSLGYPEKLTNSLGRFLPRFGFAYRPQGSGDMVIRGGYGVYNGLLRFAGLQTGGPFAVTEAYDNRIITASDGTRRPEFAWPNLFTGSGAGSASTGSSVSTDFRPEYTQSWSVSLEKELWKTWGARLTYKGTKSTQMPTQYNINTPLLSTQPFSQSRRPYPAFQNLTRIENGGNDRYHAFEAILQHPFRNGLWVQIGYSEQRATNDLGGGAQGVIRDSTPQATLDYAYDRTRDKTRNPHWPEHDLLVNFAYDLPFGKGKEYLKDLHPLANGVIGGWSVTGFFNWHSGNFFTPLYAGSDPGNINQFSGRPDVVPGCQIYTGAALGKDEPYFNRSCFTIPRPGTLGNAGINSLVGPGQWVFSLNPFKDFKLPGERVTFRIGASIYNLFNHPVYGAPSGLITTAVGDKLTVYPFVRRGTEVGPNGQRGIIVSARLLF